MHCTTWIKLLLFVFIFVFIFIFTLLLLILILIFYYTILKDDIVQTIFLSLFFSFLLFCFVLFSLFNLFYFNLFYFIFSFLFSLVLYIVYLIFLGIVFIQKSLLVQLVKYLRLSRERPGFESPTESSFFCFYKKCFNFNLFYFILFNLKRSRSTGRHSHVD